MKFLIKSIEEIRQATSDETPTTTETPNPQIVREVVTSTTAGLTTSGVIFINLTKGFFNIIHKILIFGTLISKLTFIDESNNINSADKHNNNNNNESTSDNSNANCSNNCSSSINNNQSVSDNSSTNGSTTSWDNNSSDNNKHFGTTQDLSSTSVRIRNQNCQFASGQGGSQSYNG